MQDLRDALADAPGQPDAVRRMSALALESGIRLPRGQYATGTQLPSGLVTTEISLGFAASYPATRAFIESVLREMPEVSLDRISIEREAAHGNPVRVNARFTLWRWPTRSKAGGAP